MGKIVRLIDKIIMINSTIPKIIFNYEEYLINGNYKIDPSLSYVYLENRKIDFIEESWDFKCLSKLNLVVRKVIIKIFSKNIIIKSSSKKFLGNTLKVNRYQSNIKIYDTINNKVLTIFKLEKDMLNELKIRKLFGKHFNIVDYEFDIDNNFIIEDMIDNIKIDIEKKYHLFLNDYKKYFNKISKEEYKYLDIDKFFLKYKNTILSKEINKYRKKINLKMPIVLMHGDIGDLNMIFNKKIYYIDFEKTKKNYFLYDFFRFQLDQLLYNNDYTFINKYFEGVYDEYLFDYFDSFNIKFDKNDRCFYFLIFILMNIEDENIFSFFINENKKNTEVEKIKYLIKKYL